jgi:hypothetical protein
MEKEKERINNALGLIDFAITHSDCDIKWMKKVLTTDFEIEHKVGNIKYAISGRFTEKVNHKEKKEHLVAEVKVYDNNKLIWKNKINK